MANPELDSCHICKKKPVLIQSRGYPTQYKYFCGTHVSCGDWFLSIKEATIDWNQRTKDQNQPDLYKPTNADRIRGMSDEELAAWILRLVDCDKENMMCNPAEYKHSGKCDGRCLQGRLDWLRQSAEEEYI